ncbi:hypothetical protein SCHPADRAFT_643864 [Schizopora paradoxa]|uniref:Uncharacterized protein n=1 Tax=Schizopora paradoxa TaxID=27342 RepID=A0A0H2R837_9AGAM|nr:hypothetical protein SCHPADRAFT_643864 [Schizopora paradoxa]
MLNTRPNTPAASPDPPKLASMHARIQRRGTTCIRTTFTSCLHSNCLFFQPYFNADSATRTSRGVANYGEAEHPPPPTSFKTSRLRLSSCTIRGKYCAREAVQLESLSRGDLLLSDAARLSVFGCMSSGVGCAATTRTRNWRRELVTGTALARD